MRFLSDIAEEIILILKAIMWLLEFEPKKKDMVILVFMPFGDRLLKHIASMVIDALEM